MIAIQYVTGADLLFAEKRVFPAVPMSGAVTVTLKDKVVSDDFRGFGVAITGSSCYELSLMEPNARKAFLQSIYGKDGLNLSVGRLTVASSDYSAELYSYDDVDGDVGLEHFSIDRDRVYIIPMIREILKIRPDLYLFASPWSPPAWMKTGGSLCGGYMRNEYVDCYADYVVRYLKEYEKCGIRIRALTPQNEPETQEKGEMPACEWHPDTEAKYISVLRRKLKEAGLDVGIWMHDHSFNLVPRVTWMLDTHKDLLTDCDGVAFHYYHGAIEETTVIQQKYPGLKLHFTEGGPRLQDCYATDWCKWSILMAKVLNLGYGSFTGWNLMLDETGGPNVGPFACGGLVTRNGMTGELTYSGQYRALEHLSRFFVPGSRVLETGIDGNHCGMAHFPERDWDVTATAFRNPDGKKIAVLVNPDKAKKKQVQLRDGKNLWYVELLPDTVSTVVLEEENAAD